MLDNLHTRPIEELRVLAAQYGIDVHHRAKAETVAGLIVEHIANAQKAKPEMQHPAEKPAPQPTKINTQDEVREVLKKYLERPSFKITFTDDTWHMTCAGAEDSGHMTVPLRVIKMKAENVARGMRKPRAMDFDGDKILAV